MDLSDGLGRDAGRMGKASGVQIAIDESAIPISPSARTIHGAIADGEDYELLFCVPPDVSVPACCNNGRTPITRIGRVQAGPPGAVLLRQGQAVDISQLGWEH
jgi:thiamine-monophosphate kinase